MADPVTTAIATVTAVTGKAVAIDANGVSRVIKAGDKIMKGERVVTDAGARVELLMLDGKTFPIEQAQTVTLDADTSTATRPTAQEGQVPGATVDSVINALNTGGNLDNLDATAAGLGGGSGGDGSSFVRLLRIVEGTDPLTFVYAPLDNSVPPPEVIDPELVLVVPPPSITLQVFLVQFDSETEDYEIRTTPLEEGEVATYVVLAVGEDGIPLVNQPSGTVQVTFVDGNAQHGPDYDPNGGSVVTIGQTFTADIVDDIFAEPQEGYSIEIDGFSDAGSYSGVTYVPTDSTIVDEEALDDFGVDGHDMSG